VNDYHSRHEGPSSTGLRTFRTEYGKKARAGLLLHTGNTLEWLAPDVLAAPWWKVPVTIHHRTAHRDDQHAGDDSDIAR
jgi:hypothetical protein